MRQLRFFLVICICINASLGFTCKEAERKALLKFKHSIKTRSGLCSEFNIESSCCNCNNNLTSWVGDEDCCTWNGVGCDAITGNVIKLDLGVDEHDRNYNLEAGEVNPALLELKCLTYLDLTSIDFNGARIPEFFGSMTHLQHLILSSPSFGGIVPPQLGNLIKLVVLDLRPLRRDWVVGLHLRPLRRDWDTKRSLEIGASGLEWAFKLKNLEYLDLSGIDLSQALDSLTILHKLPSLSVLKMSLCGLGNSHLVTLNSTFSSTTLRSLDFSLNNFSGPIPGFMQNLSSIRSLDLSNNYFTSPIPSWLSTKGNLAQLSLGHNGFNGPFPWFVQNLTSLTRLDLSYNQFSSSVPSWLASKRYLEYLDLSNNNFSYVDGGIMNIIGCLCRLKGLDLSSNQLQEEILESYVNVSRCSKYDLQYLNIKNNNISGYLPIIGNLSSLFQIDLSSNNLEGFPPSLAGLSSLMFVELSHNHINVVPPVIGNFSSITNLGLSFNHLESLPQSFQGLSSFYLLYLSNNHFRVVLPSIRSLPRLRILDLSYNNLSVVNQVSLANLSGLNFLYISSNPLRLDISPNWMPPFQLQMLRAQSCNLNSSFPKWILTQKMLSDLDLSHCGIFRSLPINIGNAIPSLASLRLANNLIIGSIPRSLCELEGLQVLDLQKNMLSEIIPNCWENSEILGLQLSSNRLSGHIPKSLSKVVTLKLLSLGNNSLEGEIPQPWCNSTELEILDMGMNNLHGEIPPWNGVNFPYLKILILRENRFNGSIPQQLCSFKALQIIDLASNNLVGTIPQCFGYFNGMGSMQPLNSPTISNNEFWGDTMKEWSVMEVIKGEVREYTTILNLLVNMDLSCNHLVGIIPEEITSLSLLLGLNFSHNHLNGTIPREIGKMRSLESLDFSFNNLFGSIPQSISSLDSLSNLNFSFNNLQGKIPTGRHLQTLNDSSIYMGNPGLCGEPSPEKCFGDDTVHPPTSEALEDVGGNTQEKMWFYMVIMLGCATGFWGVIGILIVHKRWRHAYFQIAEELADWIYVRVTVVIARNQRKIRS